VAPLDGIFCHHLVMIARYRALSAFSPKADSHVMPSGAPARGFMIFIFESAFEFAHFKF
jgi:hypothetical protein